MALLGWLLGLIYGSGHVLLTAIISGALLGLLGLRPLKLALGLVVGAVAGLALRALDDSLEPALVAAAVTVAYRVIAAIVYRNRPLVRIMAEEVPAAELAYVVPFEARSRYVGADYVEQLAEVRGGTFRRNPPDVGILASLDALRGPTFDPGRVHPLIREFYEHTSRFKLSIVPEWRRWMKPGYEVFKRVVAEPLGQAAIPSNIEEAQRGMVSTIDTIDLDGDEVIDIRGWIRTFADSGKPIYVGIYTSFRHDERGYVSVGFPIPGSNFTATLEPRNEGASDLVLTSRSDLPFPGHYLSSVDSERDALTVIKLLSFEERIHVFVRRRRAADRAQLLARRPALPDPPLRDRTARPHVVLIRPPSMTKFDPLTLAVRGEARTVTRVATSRGVVKRPVGMPAIACSRTLSASTPVARPMVAATPSSPSHRSVSTWPGETLAMRMPCGASSCDSALATLSSAALAAP